LAWDISSTDEKYPVALDVLESYQLKNGGIDILDRKYHKKPMSFDIVLRPKKTRNISKNAQAKKCLKSEPPFYFSDF